MGGLQKLMTFLGRFDTYKGGVSLGLSFQMKRRRGKFSVICFLVSFFLRCKVIGKRKVRYPVLLWSRERSALISAGSKAFSGKFSAPA
jgi:hypothetical protein